jgi:hypothetical protein
MLQAIFSIDPLILASSVAMLAIAVGLLVRRRMMLQRLERERFADSADEGGGVSSELPLAHLASAVEVLDLDDLLAGEEGAVAAAARRQLEAPTDVWVGPDTFFPLAPLPKTAPAAPVEPKMPPPMAARSDGAHNPAHAAGASSSETTERPVPVRELALAWFEARGYRPSNASRAVRPIELVLRHRQDPARAYAFVVENEKVTSKRVAELVSHARSIGLTRVLVAAETGIEPETRTRFRRQGVRLVDQDAMRREFEKLDLKIAAKIIAVARSRSRLRRAH